MRSLQQSTTARNFARPHFFQVSDGKPQRNEKMMSGRIISIVRATITETKTMQTR